MKLKQFTEQENLRNFRKSPVGGHRHKGLQIHTSQDS